jgi:hypothetical protein
MYCVQQIEQLALVLVYALDLDVDQHTIVNQDSRARLDGPAKPQFVTTVNVAPRLAEFFVIFKAAKFTKLLEFSNPPVP